MSEKKTLSKVERFALNSARQKAIEAQDDFNSIIEDVAAAHDIKKKEAERWKFSKDFSFVEYVPPLLPPPAPEGTPEPLSAPNSDVPQSNS